jgi:hypothetical protein
MVSVNENLPSTAALVDGNAKTRLTIFAKRGYNE